MDRQNQIDPVNPTGDESCDRSCDNGIITKIHPVSIPVREQRTRDSTPTHATIKEGYSSCGLVSIVMILCLFDFFCPLVGGTSYPRAKDSNPLRTIKS